MQRKTFVLYMDYEDKLAPLTDEELGKIMRGIWLYLRTKKEPNNLSEKLKYVFNFIKVDLDGNDKKYQEKVDRLRENAKSSKSKRNANKSKQIDSDSEDTTNTNTNTNKDLEEESMREETFKKIQEEFNLVGLSKVTTLSKSRKEKLKLRIKEFGEATIISAIQKIPKSEFLMGKNKNGWKCTFDWLIENDKNILKVYEGNYDGNEKTVEDKVNNAKEMMKYR